MPFLQADFLPEFSVLCVHHRRTFSEDLRDANSADLLFNWSRHLLNLWNNYFLQHHTKHSATQQANRINSEQVANDLIHLNWDTLETCKGIENWDNLLYCRQEQEISIIIIPLWNVRQLLLTIRKHVNTESSSRQWASKCSINQFVSVAFPFSQDWSLFRLVVLSVRKLIYAKLSLII